MAQACAVAAATAAHADSGIAAKAVAVAGKVVLTAGASPGGGAATAVALAAAVVQHLEGATPHKAVAVAVETARTRGGSPDEILAAAVVAAGVVAPLYAASVAGVSVAAWKQAEGALVRHCTRQSCSQS